MFGGQRINFERVTERNRENSNVIKKPVRLWLWQRRVGREEGCGVNSNGIICNEKDGVGRGESLGRKRIKFKFDEGRCVDEDGRGRRRLGCGLQLRGYTWRDLFIFLW